MMHRFVLHKQRGAFLAPWGNLAKVTRSASLHLENLEEKNRKAQTNAADVRTSQIKSADFFTFVRQIKAQGRVRPMVRNPEMKGRMIL